MSQYCHAGSWTEDGPAPLVSAAEPQIDQSIQGVGVGGAYTTKQNRRKWDEKNLQGKKQMHVKTYSSQQLSWIIKPHLSFRVNSNQSQGARRCTNNGQHVLVLTVTHKSQFLWEKMLGGILILCRRMTRSKIYLCCGSEWSIPRNTTQ